MCTPRPLVCPEWTVIWCCVFAAVLFAGGASTSPPRLFVVLAYNYASSAHIGPLVAIRCSVQTSVVALGCPRPYLHWLGWPRSLWDSSNLSSLEAISLPLGLVRRSRYGLHARPSRRALACRLFRRTSRLRHSARRALSQRCHLTGRGFGSWPLLRATPSRPSFLRL